MRAARHHKGPPLQRSANHRVKVRVRVRVRLEVGLGLGLRRTFAMTDLCDDLKNGH